VLSSVNVPPGAIALGGNTPNGWVNKVSLSILFFMKRVPLIRIGLFISVFPILLAFVASLLNGTSMFDEGSGSGGYLWLLMGTVPIGLLLVVIGAIVALFRRLKPKGQL